MTRNMWRIEKKTLIMLNTMILFSLIISQTDMSDEKEKPGFQSLLNSIRLLQTFYHQIIQSSLRQEVVLINRYQFD